MKLISCAVLALFACPAVAQAAPIVWAFQNATFDDGGTLVGNFTYDATTQTYSNFLLSASGGSSPAATYTSLDNFRALSKDGFFIYNKASNSSLQILFSPNLSDFGGSAAIFSGASRQAFSTSARALSGSVAAVAVTTPVGAVPEPATWAMMIGGFGLVGASMRRRATRVRFA